MLQLFNTHGRNKVPFSPINQKQVSLYVCGVTIYDRCHIGHGRTFVIFDMIVRYLRFLGYDVYYVRNITDIDDKIIQRANANNESVKQLTDRMLTEMYYDFDALGIARPNSEPKATESIDDIISLIKTLLKKKHAYIGTNGDVLFAVDSYSGYGTLSRQNLDQLYAGARVEVAESKSNPLDFVLWKRAKPNEPKWDSPWGPGRPGWHIECSAMNFRELGSHFDIHGGGSDLLFPHHENEQAQSVCAHGKFYVNYWLHSGMIMVDQEKMSKSLGNVLTIRDVLQQYDPETVRYFLLSAQYRNQLNYSENNLKQAHAALERLYNALRNTTPKPLDTDSQSSYFHHFKAAMNDDFNTPLACAVLFDLASAINKAKAESNTSCANQLASELCFLGAILGFLQQEPDSFLQAAQKTNANSDKINSLIAERNAARLAKDWIKADKTRDALLAMDIILEDTATGTTWRHK